MKAKLSEFNSEKSPLEHRFEGPEGDIGDRRILRELTRIVVKVGTNVLVKRAGELHRPRMKSLVRQIAKFRQMGKEVVLVSSGAIGAGLEALGAKRRPKDLQSLQIAAAVGQSLLMAEYGKLFAKEGLIVAQLLLTHDDLRNRTRHLNMRNTVLGLMSRGIIPIVNENDVVSVDELKFGDNDVLAALLSSLVEAELLVLLSTTNGLRESVHGKLGRRVPYLPAVTSNVLSWADGKGNDLSLGGMESKLHAVRMALKVPASAVIVDGRDPKNLTRVIMGKDVGTLFGHPSHPAVDELNSRKRWIAFFHKPRGSVVVDDGAAKALIEKGVSLLPVGVKKVEGTFGVGDVVNVCNSSGHVIARGLVSFSSADLQKIIGRRSVELPQILGCTTFLEVIHRDNMAIL